MAETTVGRVVAEILADAELLPHDLDKAAQDAIAQLKSSKPNAENLTELSIDGSERIYAADGMPIFGVYEDSYDHAPVEYARRYGSYPRNDSPTREDASDDGARINEGANFHLRDNYAGMVKLLGSIVKARREQPDLADSPDIELSKEQALGILNACVSMWSYLLYRKNNRTPKGQLPPEVGLLVRAMSGVRMSLLSLYIRDRYHGFSMTSGWENEPFNAENWANAVEESGKLVGEGPQDPTQLCVASSRMIRDTIENVVNPLRPGQEFVDIEQTYDLTPQSLLQYGNAWFLLEQARARRADIISVATSMIEDYFKMTNVIFRSEMKDGAVLIKSVLGPKMKAAEVEVEQRLKDVLEILGYKS